MAIVLDVIVIAIVVLFAMIGYKSGFVKTLIELIGWVAVLLFATALANKISTFIFDSFISSIIHNAIDDSITEFGHNGVKEFFNKMPEYLRNLLNAYGVSFESVSESIGIDNVSSALVEQLKTPIVSLISFLLNVIIFVLGIILVRVLARVCNSVVSRIPLVSTINRALGFVSGVAKGFVISIVICWIFVFVVMFSGDAFGITGETINDTQLIRYLNELNPLINFA